MQQNELRASNEFQGGKALKTAPKMLLFFIGGWSEAVGGRAFFRPIGFLFALKFHSSSRDSDFNNLKFLSVPPAEKANVTGKELNDVGWHTPPIPLCLLK